MYDDLISPGLLDYSFNSGLLAHPVSWWGTISAYIRDFLVWSIDLMRSLSLWIRSEPLVMAVVSIFFAGFVVAIFFRLYHSC